MKKIAICLITYNNCVETLRDWLYSVSASLDKVSKDISLMVYYVDHGEESKLIDIDPGLGLNVIKLPTIGNQGFAKGANRLLKEACKDGATAAILTNPDGRFHPLCLYHMMQAHDQDNSCLIEASQFPEEHPKEYDASTLVTKWASGCCVLIPSHVFNRVRGFDEHFFMYIEDVDFSWRVRAAGFSIKYCPNALYSHDVLAREDSLQTELFYLGSMRYFAWKWRQKRLYKEIDEKIQSNAKYASLGVLDKKLVQTIRLIDVVRFSDFSCPGEFAKLRWHN
jgi:GT2 family glycosyltransferase